MARSLVLFLLMAFAAQTAQVPSPSPAGDSVPAVSFNKDVFPILQNNCQVCHRPVEAAPMSFLTYADARPWAKAIKQAVLTRKMPPWFADPHYGDFRNAPRLTAADIKTLASWADNGALEGDAREKPAPVDWPNGWRTKPDVILSIPEPYNVPAKGAGEIKAFLVDNPFKEDTWVNSIEIRPGEPSVVHHVMLQVPEPGPSFSWGGVAGSACIPASGAEAFLESPITLGKPTPNGQTQPPKPPKNFAILESVYVPGSPVTDFQYSDSGKLIKGGGQLRIEVHYTPNGKAVADQTKIGFVLAKTTPQRRFIMLAPKSIANTRIRIPAGESNWETRGELQFGQDAQLVWFMPHMHLRGKDMTFDLIYPNGRTETVLSAKFNFNWQLGYELEEPISVKKGTRMVIIAHHDNSANNPYNPDPEKDVAWGNLTSEEMVLPWFGVVVDKNADPERILAIRQNGCSLGKAIQSGLPAISSPLPFPVPARRNGK